jgi:hypothetical protein
MTITNTIEDGAACRPTEIFSMIDQRARNDIRYAEWQRKIWLYAGHDAPDYFAPPKQSVMGEALGLIGLCLFLAALIALPLMLAYLIQSAPQPEVRDFPAAAKEFEYSRAQRDWGDQ